MESAIIYPSIIWLLIGITMIMLEFHAPGIGLLFLGLGATSTSIIINYWPYHGYFLPFVYCGISSMFWFLILWYPLTLFNRKKKYVKYSNGIFDMVGQEVIVVNCDIDTQNIGQVSWSGTIFNASFTSTTPLSLAKIGDKLYVQEVNGNILICARRQTV